MNKSIGVLLLVGVLLLGYVVAGPFLTMHRISDAIVTRDAALLEDAVDFETLRTGLTEQFSARIVGAAEKNAQHNPLASLAAGFASTLVETMVNAIVTPAGIIRIIEESSRISRNDREPGSVPAPTPEPQDDGSAPGKSDGQGRSEQDKSEQDEAKKAQDDIFAGADFRFHGPSRFSATLGNTERNTTRFIFRRDGIHWKLTNILLPQDVK